jgi:hypothetical protein
LISIGATGETIPTDNVNDHLEKGKMLLATGQLADALSHFHSAIGMRKLMYRILRLSLFNRC